MSIHSHHFHRSLWWSSSSMVNSDIIVSTGIQLFSNCLVSSRDPVNYNLSMDGGRNCVGMAHRDCYKWIIGTDYIGQL